MGLIINHFSEDIIILKFCEYNLIGDATDVFTVLSELLVLFISLSCRSSGAIPKCFFNRSLYPLRFSRMITYICLVEMLKPRSWIFCDMVV